MSGRDDRASLVDTLNCAEEAVVLLGEVSLNDLPPFIKRLKAIPTSDTGGQL